MALSLHSKRHLKDIERQCDMELTKMRSYIRNIGELKGHWKSLAPGPPLGEFRSEDGVNQRIRAFVDDRMGSKSDAFFNK